MCKALRLTAAFLGIATSAAHLCAAQDGKTAREAANNEPVVFTTEQDHRNMLDQLGIIKLRSGRDSNPNSPRAANADQAKANPYPKLPALLVTKDGKKVTTAEQWWTERRPEIVEMLEREVYGRIPKRVPKVKWEVRDDQGDRSGWSTGDSATDHRRGGQRGVSGDQCQHFHVVDVAESGEGLRTGVVELWMDAVRAVSV